MSNNIFKRKCQLCAEKISVVNYRDVNFLKKFLTPYGKIAPSRRTGCCAKHQRMMTKAIKRARILGLLPYKK